MRSLAVPVLTIAALVAGWSIYAAAQPEIVYGPAENYVVERLVDGAGHDRIRITASVKKLKSCDLESGDGPPWVDFYDDSDGGVPPPSAFYKPDGLPTGNTMGDAGEIVDVSGYTAIVPNKMRDAGGTFVVRIPCQLWTEAEDGSKTWGRKVVASWGPLPVPLPGRSITSAPAVAAR